jgi:hypothetical protein
VTRLRDFRPRRQVAAAPRYLEPGVPAGSAAARRQSQSLGLQPGGREQPRDHRVRVPHLARAQLVAPPDRRGHEGDGVEQAAGGDWIGGDSLRFFDGVPEVRDRPAAPAADLVSEQAQPAEVATADGACGHHAPARRVGVRGRRDLDRVAIGAELDDHGRVVQVTALTPSARGVDRLEHAPVEPDATAACAERDPVQVHGCGRGRLHRPNARRERSGPHPRFPRSSTAGCPREARRGS